MRNILKYIIYAVLILAAISCKEQQGSNTDNFRIAFMADVHLQDVYGQFQDNDYKGVLNPKNGKFVTIRTMEAQLHSTRIFNENYFAFLAALDDVVKRGVKYVVLPGDFSDDGQPVNIRGLKRILDEYSEKYGLSFFATTGNHDPVRPFSQAAGKHDFFGSGGKSQTIVSEKGMSQSVSNHDSPVVFTQDIRKMGYWEIVSMLGDYGFFPKKEYLYWETPFTNYQLQNYSYSKALAESDLENRNYTIEPYNLQIPDVSYLVEPIKGIWLLAIDANAYIPNENAKYNPNDPLSFSGASTGYNNVLTHKKHLIDWVKKVTQQADSLGKTLLVFSHYPMIEFNDDASVFIRKLLGEGKMQLHRVPDEDVARIFADAGIKLHFGGHMHINDTGIRKTEKGNTLVNVQIPSLAAYIPAYKLLTVKRNDLMEVETIVIDSVPRFNEFFDLYKQEYAYLQNIGEDNIWNKDILNTKNYHEFTSSHLKELVRLRFIPNDWPSDFRDFLLDTSGKELLILSQLNPGFSLKGIWASIGGKNSELTDSWNTATQKAGQEAKKAGLQFEQFGEWNGFDLIFDFYRLRNADKLAVEDIGVDRVRQYQLIANSFLQDQTNQPLELDSLRNNFQEFFKILGCFLNGSPAGHFTVDLKSGKLESLFR